MLIRRKSYQKLLKSDPEEAKFLREKLEETTLLTKKEVENTFMRALIGLDPATIHRIADAVLYFQQRMGKMGSSESVEPLRCRLLLLRHELEQNGETMSVREVAEKLKLPKTPEDGFASLRRLCKSLYFPLSNKRRERRVVHKFKS